MQDVQSDMARDVGCSASLFRWSVLELDEAWQLQSRTCIRRHLYVT